MLFRDCIDLLTITISRNSNGFETETVTGRRTVFANKKSIRQSEFYQAAAQGINLTISFDIRSIDYNGEQTLEYNGKQYNIVRTFDKNGEIIELVCNDKLKNSGRKVI